MHSEGRREAKLASGRTRLFEGRWGAIQLFLRIILNLRILVLSTLPYVFKVNTYS
jgi:hypothetical protein